MNAEQAALLERFNGFLSKIDERLSELMTEAENGLGALFAEHPDDPLVVGNALSGLDYQIDQLRNKVQETWDGQIEPAFDRLGDGGFLDLGLDRKEDFLLGFSERWDTFKTGAMVAFYENMRPLADAALAKEFRCSACSATIDLPSKIEPASIYCPFCRAVNQVIPDAVVTQYYGSGFGGGAAHSAAEAAALPLRYDVERHQIAINRDRRGRSWGQETLAQLEAWERLELAYWTRYTEIRAELSGQPPDRELVQSRMDAFRKYNLENNQVWRRAKGPA
jgi:hypothetical protein